MRQVVRCCVSPAMWEAALARGCDNRLLVGGKKSALLLLLGCLLLAPLERQLLPLLLGQELGLRRVAATDTSCTPPHALLLACRTMHMSPRKTVVHR